MELTFFDGVDLRGADLRGAVMNYVLLSDADLRGADLRGVSCDYFSLRSLATRADLEGAEMDADLKEELAAVEGLPSLGAVVEDGPGLGG